MIERTGEAMDYVWQKLVEAVDCLNGPGTIQRRIVEVGVGSGNLEGDEFRSPDERVRWSRIVERRSAGKEVVGRGEGSYDASVPAAAIQPVWSVVPTKGV